MTNKAAPNGRSWWQRLSENSKITLIAALITGGLGIFGVIVGVLADGHPNAAPPSSSASSPPGGSPKSTAVPGPTALPTTPPVQSPSPQLPAGMTLQITPDHGGINATINVFGTGCPQGDQIDIYFDGKALFPAPMCQANHKYQHSYSPDQNGTLPWVDGSGSSKKFTLSPDQAYYVYAQDVLGGSVSPRVTYQVG